MSGFRINNHKVNVNFNNIHIYDETWKITFHHINDEVIEFTVNDVLRLKNIANEFEEFKNKYTDLLEYHRGLLDMQIESDLAKLKSQEKTQI